MALVFCLLTLASGLLGPVPAHAQAQGLLGGFLEMSEVFFSEGDRTFGPGETVAVSGAIPFTPWCPGMGFAGKGRAELQRGFADPFPTADFYVIPDTGQQLADYAELQDVSGGVNRVIGLSSGAFVDEVVAVTQPAGMLGAGRYDVVMDQCLDGLYDPFIDIVLGDGAGFAFEVVVPSGGVLDPINFHPIKQKAKLYSLVLKGHKETLPGGDVSVDFPGFCQAYERLKDEADLKSSQGLGLWAGLAKEKCDDLIAHWEGIANDPPDPNFTQFAELGALGYDFTAPATPLQRVNRTLAHAMAEHAAASKALLTSLERFQGAQQAGNHEYMALQLEEADKYIKLLISGGGSLIRFYAALEAFDLALSRDPLGNEPEAQELRNLIPEMRRALGGLLDPLGPRFLRVKIGHGQERLVPAGLQAWITVYLGRDPFLPPLGLFGIPQVREFNGLPPIAFQHPDAFILGPLAAPPDRAITLDATKSSDPNGDILSFAWDLDGDGQFDDASGASVQHAFSEPGTRLAGVRASDAAGNTDVRYVLIKIGDLNSQDIIAMPLSGELLRIAPEGAFTTLSHGQGFSVQVLHVDVNGDIWVLHLHNFAHHNSSGVLLKTVTLEQFSNLTGEPLTNFLNFVLDGRGDILVLAMQEVGPVQTVKLFRLAKDANSASFIADLNRRDQSATDGCLSGTTALPGMALDGNGNVVVAGINAMDLQRSATGVWTVDPNTGQLQEVIPAGAISSCPQVTDPRIGTFGEILLAFGGNALNERLSGNQLQGGVEVDSQGHYIMGTGQVATPLRLYRIPLPPTFYPGSFGRALLEVFPTYSAVASSDFVSFRDIALDGSGDYLVGGDHFGLGRGVFRIDPTGVLSKVSDARGPFHAVTVLDVVPEIREVTPKDIPTDPRLALSNLTVNQVACPGAAELNVTLTNSGTGVVGHPVRVYFFDGDPEAGGLVLGSAVAPAPIAAGASVNVTAQWPNSGPGTHEIFALAAGANTRSRAFQVCTPLQAPGTAIQLRPAQASNDVGASHTVTAIVRDVLAKPVPGVPLAFEVTGANTASGNGVTDANGTASFAYLGRAAGQDSIVAKTFGDESNPVANLWVAADTTPPVVELSLSKPPNAAGWHNSIVTVTWSVADPESGIASSSGCDEITVTTDTAGVILTCSATNDAGLSASESVTLRLDQTPPVVTVSLTPGPNGFGWNNTDVTARFAASDALSGIEGPAVADVRFALEGRDQGATRTFTDVAGNGATGEIAGINIDKTPPAIAGSRDPLPNAAGWNNVDVTVSFACADGLSGMESCGPTPLVVSTEGAGQSRSATAVDRAGNTVSITVGDINIDKTGPVVSCAASPDTLWPPNHKMLLVNVSVTVADAGSGPSGFSLLWATSSEPDNGLGDGDTMNDIQAFEVGMPDTSGLLRAERSGLGTGRLYSLGYLGTDQAGNAATCEATVTVPHNR